MANDVHITIITEHKGQDAVKKVDSSFKNLMSTFAKVTASAAAIGYAMKKAFDFAQAGANIMRLKDSGDKLAASLGANYDTILNKLDNAAQGTIANSDLMLAANRAMMLGIGADADKLANLLEVAAFRGRAMGITTSQAFSDIVTGIGRMSPMILDNLGIVIDADKRYQEYSDSLGITTDAIDSAAKRQILLNGVLEEGNKMLADAGGLVPDLATEYEKLGSTWTNVMDGMKKDLAEGGDSPVGSINTFLKAWNMMADEVRAGRMTLGEARLDFAGALFPLGTVSWQSIIDNINEAQEAYDKLISRSPEEFASHVDEVTDATDNLSQALDIAGQSGRNFGGGFEEVGRMSQFAVRALRKIEEGANKSTGALQRLNGIDLNIGSKIKNEIDQIKWDQMGGTIIEEMYNEINRQFDAGLIDEATAQKALEEIGIAAQVMQDRIDGVSAADTTKTISQDFDTSWKNAAEGVGDVQNALDTMTLKDYIVNVFIKTTGRVPGQLQGAPDLGGQTGRDYGGASGTPGWMTVPAGYPNDSYTVGMTSGENFYIARQGEGTTKSTPIADGQSMGTGPISINIYPLPGQDENAIAARVYQMLKGGAQMARAGAGYAGA